MSRGDELSGVEVFLGAVLTSDGVYVEEALCGWDCWLWSRGHG